MVIIDYNFDNKLVQIRKKLNVSQEHLAKNSNLSQSFISQLERGKRSPTIDTLYKISKGLNIPMKNFLLYIINEISSDNLLNSIFIKFKK